MDFDLTPEQQMLSDNVSRLLKARYGFDQRKTYQASPVGFSEALWRDYAGMGLLGIGFDEADGGFGGGAVETMLVMEALGRALALEPYLQCVVLAGGLLRRAPAGEARGAAIAAIVAGEARLGFAQAEKQSGYDLHDVATRARRQGGGYVLDGEKVMVGQGDSADRFVVLARTAGAQRDRSGLGLFLVDAGAPGVSRRGYPTQDGQRAADVAFASVEVPAESALGDPEGALPIVERVVEEAIAALCAEAVGAMEEALTTTVDYLKARKQFGVAIGSFQALQHRAAEMVVALEQARSMMMLASMSIDEEDAAERTKAISAAKAQIGQSGRFIGRQAVQLHGGVAMTQVYKLGHYFKRLAMIDVSFGDPDAHLRRLGEAGGLFA